MNIEQKIKTLQTHPLFKDFKTEEIKLIAEKTKEKIFPPKTIIISQLERANAIYFIYKGLVRIYILNIDGRIIPIRVKEPLYIVGELNLFDDESTANVETIQETHTLVFTKELCNRLITEHPGFAFNLLKMITEKLRTANKQTNYYFSIRLKERIWGVLKMLSPHFASSGISLSQEELSFIVGASRARVTEVLHELAAEKLICISQRKIRLL